MRAHAGVGESTVSKALGLVYAQVAPPSCPVHLRPARLWARQLLQSDHHRFQSRCGAGAGLFGKGLGAQGALTRSCFRSGQHAPSGRQRQDRRKLPAAPRPDSPGDCVHRAGFLQAESGAPTPEDPRRGADPAGTDCTFSSRSHRAVGGPVRFGWARGGGGGEGLACQGQPCMGARHWLTGVMRCAAGFRKLT